jgi:hypothetical protein
VRILLFYIFGIFITRLRLRGILANALQLIAYLTLTAMLRYSRQLVARSPTGTFLVQRLYLPLLLSESTCRSRGYVQAAKQEHRSCRRSVCVLPLSTSSPLRTRSARGSQVSLHVLSNQPCLILTLLIAEVDCSYKIEGVSGGEHCPRRPSKSCMAITIWKAQCIGC